MGYSDADTQTEFGQMNPTLSQITGSPLSDQWIFSEIFPVIMFYIFGGKKQTKPNKRTTNTESCSSGKWIAFYFCFYT